MPNGRLASLTLYSAEGGRQRLEGGQLRGHASDLLRVRGDLMHGQEHDSWRVMIDELPSEKDTIQKTKKGKTDENAKKINDDDDDARVVSFYWKCVQAWGHKLLQWLNRLA